LRPGSSEFQKFLTKKHPMRPGERMGEYLYRLHNTLSIKHSRMKDLWYGSYGKCDDDFNRFEREKIFGQPRPEIQDKRLNENSELREELREIKQYLRARDDKFKLVMEALFS
jgi:hypothetical protein